MKILLGEKERFKIDTKDFIFKTKEIENKDDKLRKMVLRRIDKIKDLLFYDGKFIISTILLNDIKDYVYFDIYVKEKDDIILFNIENFNTIDNKVLRKTLFNFIVKVLVTIFRKDVIAIKNINIAEFEKYRLFIVNNNFYFNKFNKNKT